MIGDDIEVSVLAIVGEKVRIGIQAPRDVPVFRKEVYLEIQDEHREPAKPEDVVAEVDAALQGLSEPGGADQSSIRARRLGSAGALRCPGLSSVPGATCRVRMFGVDSMSICDMESATN